MAAAAGGPVPFGARLKRVRRDAGLTPAALAVRARVSARAVRALERGGARAPQRETVSRLAAALALPAGEAAAEAGAARAGTLPAAAGAAPSPAALPTGTVTFLFTDLEGSTTLLEAHPAAYRAAVRRHHALLRGAVEAHGGVVFETVGDAVYAAFAGPTAAVAAALAGQRELVAADWGELGAGALRARMGLHAGEVEVQGGHYFGAPLYRCARLTAAAHGGQVVLSEAATALVREALPAGATVRDLGAHRLKDLQAPERMAQLVHPDLPAAFPPLRSLDARAHNLPRQLTSFVGRERELAAVGARLLDPAVRLVTLTGPGGVGKTRLALQAAAEALDAPGAFPDGVWFVALAPLAHSGLVAAAIAQVLGVQEAPGRPLVECLKDALRSKALLLVLDNCEHLLGAAPLVAELLAAAAGLKVLVTSRAVLRLAGEHALPVPPLALPAPPGSGSLAGPARAEAVALFVQRAAAGRPDFALTAENAPAVAEICRRLDGLPLAIELAAARVRLMSPPALLARLERRLPLLTGGPRDAPARQQTLRAALDWSHRLLPPAEQVLFRRLAVFAGACTLAAAEAVCASGTSDRAAADVLSGLAALVDRSLIWMQEAPDGEPRYGMLQTIREYASERLRAAGETDGISRRHAACYLALGEEAASQLMGPRQEEWLVRLEHEHDDLRAALRWLATSGDAEALLRLAGALQRFWDLYGFWSEGRSWLGRALAAAEGEGHRRSRAIALQGAATLAWLQGDFKAAQPLGEASVRLWREVGDKRGLACALTGLWWPIAQEADRRAAEAAYEESVALFRELGDDGGLVPGLGCLATLALLRGDHAAALRHCEESLRIARRLADQAHVVDLLNRLGDIARSTGDYRRAAAHYAECLEHSRAGGQRAATAWAVHNLGCVVGHEGDTVRAVALQRESLGAFWELGDVSGIAWCLVAFAGPASARGQPERTARLLGAADGLFEAAKIVRLPAEQNDYDRCAAAARTAVGERAFAAAFAAGRAMALEDAIAYAMAAEQADAMGAVGHEQGERDQPLMPTPASPCTR